MKSDKSSRRLWTVLISLCLAGCSSTGSSSRAEEAVVEYLAGGGVQQASVSDCVWQDPTPEGFSVYGVYLCTIESRAEWAELVPWAIITQGKAKYCFDLPALNRAGAVDRDPRLLGRLLGGEGSAGCFRYAPRIRLDP